VNRQRLACSPDLQTLFIAPRVDLLLVVAAFVGRFTLIAVSVGNRSTSSRQLRR
jgi:hypothetical protein